MEDLNNKEDEEAARKSKARYKLEGEKPTMFFCKINPNIKNKAQFVTLLVKEEDENGNEHKRKITDQNTIERGVSKLYCNLYNRQEVTINKD